MAAASTSATAGELHSSPAPSHVAAAGAPPFSIPDAHSGASVDAAVEQLRSWSTSLLSAGIHPPHVRDSRGVGALTPEDASFLSDPSVWRRYAVARDCKPAAAWDAMMATLLFRRTHVQQPLHCPACEADRYAHCFIPLGFDKLGRPVVYTSQARAQFDEVEISMQHMLHALEYMFDVGRRRSARRVAGTLPADGESDPHAHAPVEEHYQWLWLTDFNGFTFGHAMQGRMGVKAITTFSAHMPERLGSSLWINAPTIFNTFMAVVKPFIDARTMAKIHTVSGQGEALRKALVEQHLTPAQVDWVISAAGMKPTKGHLPPLPPGSREMHMRHRHTGEHIVSVDEPGMHAGGSVAGGRAAGDAEVKSGRA